MASHFEDRNLLSPTFPFFFIYVLAQTIFSIPIWIIDKHLVQRRRKSCFRKMKVLVPGALQIVFSVCEMFRCFSFLIKTRVCEEELMLVSIQILLWAAHTHLNELLDKIWAEHLERVPTCSGLKSSKWLLDAVLCSSGLRWILDTMQSQEGPVGKQILRWWCLSRPQTNAGLGTSVWPSHHYRGNCHRRCAFPSAKNAFLLGRPE